MFQLLWVTGRNYLPRMLKLIPANHFSNLRTFWTRSRFIVFWCVHDVVLMPDWNDDLHSSWTSLYGNTKFIYTIPWMHIRSVYTIYMSWVAIDPYWRNTLNKFYIIYLYNNTPSTQLLRLMPFLVQIVCVTFTRPYHVLWCKLVMRPGYFCRHHRIVMEGDTAVLGRVLPEILNVSVIIGCAVRNDISFRGIIVACVWKRVKGIQITLNSPDVRKTNILWCLWLVYWIKNYIFDLHQEQQIVLHERIKSIKSVSKFPLYYDTLWYNYRVYSWRSNSCSSCK